MNRRDVKSGRGLVRQSTVRPSIDVNKASIRSLTPPIALPIASNDRSDETRFYCAADNETPFANSNQLSRPGE